MEQKLELFYMGAAAIIFAVAIMGWMKSEQQMNQSLNVLEQRFGEERVVIESGGS